MNGPKLGEKLIISKKKTCSSLCQGVLVFCIQISPQTSKIWALYDVISPIRTQTEFKYVMIVKLSNDSELPTEPTIDHRLDSVPKNIPDVRVKTPING